MPLTLTLTEGVLTPGTEKTALARLSEAMVRWHGMAESATMKANVVGTIHVLPGSATFAGSQESKLALVEWKVPAFAFADRKIQIGYFAEATRILEELSEGGLAKEKIYINVVHAVDGAWNFDGQALTNEEIRAAVARRG